MLDAQNITDEKMLRETKLHVKLTNKGIIYGGWDNEKLFSLLKDKLVRYKNIKSLPACTDMQCDVSCNKSLHFIIHSGMYNECILLELEGKGIKRLFRMEISVHMHFVIYHFFT